MNTARRWAPPPPYRRDDGTVALVVALTLPLVLGFIGLAIDISMFYLRNTELLQLADSTAVAAARELNGTAAGVSRARLAATAMATSQYYGGAYATAKRNFVDGESWTTAALSLSSAPSGEAWTPADSITSDTAAEKLIYARVDTARLDDLSGRPGLITTTLLRMVGMANTVTAAPAAVAGRVVSQVTPLGVCALETTKFKPRDTTNNELVELGYRRGIAYDLLKLNPASASAPQNFLVNPIDAGDKPSQAVHFTQPNIMPFFCSGSIAYPNLRPGDSVHVQPLTGTDIHEWLNSRFGDYAINGCVREGAPPDTNVREYAPATTPASTPPPSARPIASGRMATIAELIATPTAPLPSDIVTTDYGPIWSFNKPVKYVAGSATGAKLPVPDKFLKGDWAVLYPATKIVAPATAPVQFPPSPTYSDTPYATQKTAPSPGYAFAQRRVLNIPLLDCSGTVGGKATVLGIGRFFMTSRATAGSVYGEFAGLASDETLNGMVSHLQ